MNPETPIRYEIAQLIHPDRWGGHCPGDGDATPDTHAVPTTWVAFTSMWQFHRRLAILRSPIPSVQYQPGDTFYAREHPDALIAIDNEKLVISHGLGIDPSAFKDIKPAPQRSVYLDSAAIFAGKPPFIVYAHQAAPALVSRKRRQAQVIGALSMPFGELLTGGVVTATTLEVFPPAIQVGIVQHLRCDEHGADIFQRVNRIDVLTPGAHHHRQTSR